jgi:hypothetical protein
LVWTDLGGGIWKGTVSLTCFNGKTSEEAVDVAKFSFTTLGYGSAYFTLTKVTIRGLDSNKQPAVIDSVIVVPTATTKIEVKYSKYDLNKDGKVDALDMVVLVIYYQFKSSDAGWDANEKVYDKFMMPIYAKACDFNGDGVVDLADLIELFINYD